MKEKLIFDPTKLSRMRDSGYCARVMDCSGFWAHFTIDEAGVPTIIGIIEVLDTNDWHYVGETASHSLLKQPTTGKFVYLY